MEIRRRTMLPRGGGYSHMSTDIICLNYDPFFTLILHQMTPFFTTVNTQWPLFFQNFSVKFQFSGAFQKFCQYSAEKDEFSLKFDKFYTKWHPICGRFFVLFCFVLFCFVFISHLITPFFLRNLTPIAPCFFLRHIPVTFIFECPPSRMLPNCGVPRWSSFICWTHRKHNTSSSIYNSRILFIAKIKMSRVM